MRAPRCGTRYSAGRREWTKANLLGEVVQYEDKYKLCYIRGPAGIIVALAGELS